jgi:hypothetical protein
MLGFFDLVYSYGILVAIVVSYDLNQSIAWAALHGLGSWGYLLYFCLSGGAQ